MKFLELKIFVVLSLEKNVAIKIQHEILTEISQIIFYFILKQTSLLGIELQQLGLMKKF